MAQCIVSRASDPIRYGIRPHLLLNPIRLVAESDPKVTGLNATQKLLNPTKSVTESNPKVAEYNP